MKLIPLPVSKGIHSLFGQPRGMSPSGQHNLFLRAGIDFFLGEKALRAFTFLWLYWAVAKFEILLLRPAELYTPNTFFGKLLAPNLPSKEVFWGLAALATVLNLWQLIKGSRMWAQAVVAGLLLWINAVLWSYGYLPYVNHLFLLAHLFFVFAYLSKMNTVVPSYEEYTGICWFYFGLLFTYTLAGIWKVGGLAFKLITQSTDVHWLKPEAALYNALVNFRDYDTPLPFPYLFLEYPLVWQIGFVLVVYLQIAAIWAAWRPALRPWMAVLFIGFHLLNQYAFWVGFVVSCLVLPCLFFPYSAFSSKYKSQRIMLREQQFKGQKLAAVCNRDYPNGDQDVFYGFEAYRQRLLSVNYYLFGILYLPGLKTLVETWWRLSALVTGKKNSMPSG